MSIFTYFTFFKFSRKISTKYLCAYFWQKKIQFTTKRMWNERISLYWQSGALFKLFNFPTSLGRKSVSESSLQTLLVLFTKKTLFFLSTFSYIFKITFFSRGFQPDIAPTELQPIYQVNWKKRKINYLTFSFYLHICSFNIL